MAMIGSNWLQEGYYEVNQDGERTRLISKEEINQALKDNKLYYTDGSGYGLDKIENL
jgi:hypothetical protein